MVLLNNEFCKIIWLNNIVLKLFEKLATSFVCKNSPFSK
jgi:hypothetical protein